jgi:hypothetical protein
MENILVKPYVLTSILPLGIKEDGSAYRFSLCIDLLSSYPLDKENNQTAPHPAGLRYFLFNYGMKDNIAAEIRNGLKVVVTNEKKEGSIMPATILFTDDFTKRNYWELLLKEKINTFLELKEERLEADAKSIFKNASFLDQAANVEQFSANLQANSVYAELEKTVRTLKEDPKMKVQDAVGPVAAKATELMPDIVLAGRQTQAVYNYALQHNTNHNDANAVSYFSAKAKLFVEYFNEIVVADVFSFIASNPVLQRLFHTTIDFEINATELKDFLKNDPSFNITVDTTANNGTIFGKPEGAMIQWKHLKTGMVHISRPNLGEVILVRNNNDITTAWVKQQKFSATNYDATAKLKSLEPMLEKIKELKAKKAFTESQRYRLYKDVITLDAAALTRGMNVYNIEIKKEIEEFLNAAKTKDPANPLAAITSPDDLLDEERVTRGFKYGIAGLTKPIIPLGTRAVSINNEDNDEIAIPEIFRNQDFAVNTDTAMHALVEETKADGTKEIKNSLIIDTALLTWSGENIGMPSIFSVQEDETNFGHDKSEGSISESAKYVIDLFLAIFKEDYGTIGMHYHGEINSGETPLMLNKDSDGKDFRFINKPINLNYAFTTNAKLLLGKTHRLCMVPQYKNGWGMEFNGRTRVKDKINTPFELGYNQLFPTSFMDFVFKRNEPVKPVQFFLMEPLLDDNNKAVAGREGESLYHLVIRNYNKEGDKEIDTSQRSVRYILPPPLSFEHAFWHNKIFEMSTDDSYDWYLKYHFPAIENQYKIDENGNLTEKKYTKKEALKGSTRMNDFYPANEKWYIPDSWEHDNIINYLPDPLSKGFRLEFYLDKNRTKKEKQYLQYEEQEYYFKGSYPFINAWRIIAKDTNDDYDDWVKSDDEKIYIRVQKGHELFITIRTILDERYEELMETYGNYNDYTRYGNNDLLTPPLEFSIIHATQRPLLRPAFHNTLQSAKDMDKTQLALVNTLTIEQLDIAEGDDGITRYLDETVPTGKIELYAKWEDYKDDPDHLLSLDDPWTPEEPLNKIDTSVIGKGDGDLEAVHEASIELSPANLEMMQGSLHKTGKSPNTSMNFSTEVRFEYDIRETRYMEKWFWIKNKSKFTSYFPSHWGSDDKDRTAQTHRDYFNQTSGEGFLTKILNNKKPTAPQLADRNIILVAVHEDRESDDKQIRKSSLNRLRLYFERGRFSSGKGERIGLVLNEAKGLYNDYLVSSGLISVAGKDILTDKTKPYDGLYRNADVLLQRSHFVTHDPYDLENESGKKASDIESFYPEYVEELGLMTYRPKLDKLLNCWYVEVELDINDDEGQELHNPFVRFAMVNYQEHSVNYNEARSTNDIAADCRISLIRQSGYVYIMGSRTIYVEQAGGKVKVTLDYDKTSVIDQILLKTEFYAFIQHRKGSGMTWSDKKGEGKERVQLPSLLLRQDTLYGELQLKDGSGDYRVLILEVEYRQLATPVVVANLDGLLADKQRRIVLVNIFDL